MTALSKTSQIHPKFTLNGISYDNGQLKELSCGLIKEGQAHEQEIGTFLRDWLNESDHIAVQTSGSTGKPKIITLSKGHMINSAHATAEFFGLKAGDSALLCLPATYIAGKMMLVRAMVLGLQLDYVAPTSNPLTTIKKTFDFCAMVPLQLQNSVKDIDLIKTLLIGGAKLDTGLIEKIQSYQCSIYETYGMTETITHVAVNYINSKKTLGPNGVERIFTALPNVHFEKDTRDCLVITAPKVSEYPVITNDIVNLISETQFEWLGRIDNVINSGGIKLIPELIEEKIKSVINTRFFVAGQPHEELGERLILVVEGKVDKTLLLNKLKSIKTLSKYELPKAIYILPKFVETPNGKISRYESVALLALS